MVGLRVTGSCNLGLTQDGVMLSNLTAEYDEATDGDRWWSPSDSEYFLPIAVRSRRAEVQGFFQNGTFASRWETLVSKEQLGETHLTKKVEGRQEY